MGDTKYLTAINDDAPRFRIRWTASFCGLERGNKSGDFARAVVNVNHGVRTHTHTQKVSLFFYFSRHLFYFFVCLTFIFASRLWVDGSMNQTSFVTWDDCRPLSLYQQQEQKKNRLLVALRSVTSASACHALCFCLTPGCGLSSIIYA